MSNLYKKERDKDKDKNGKQIQWRYDYIKNRKVIIKSLYQDKKSIKECIKHKTIIKKQNNY